MGKLQLHIDTTSITSVITAIAIYTTILTTISVVTSMYWILLDSMAILSVTMIIISLIIIKNAKT